MQVTSADPDNNSTSSSVFSFTTLNAPDTTPPVILDPGPTVKSKTDTKITVTWKTDEPASSGVSFNDGTHYDLVNDFSLVTDHEITLSGLTPSTTYSIKVSSTDAAGNGPTVSSAISATTNATPDTTPPVISNVTVSDITTSSAVVSWTTDELSNSTVVFGTKSELPDNTVGDVSNTTSHSITLSGLHDGTKYFFVVKSADTSNNTAASTESNFTTESSFIDQAPTAPGPITAPATTNAQSFDVTWGASTDDVAVAQYDVLRNDVVVATVSANTTTYTDSGLAEGPYTYQIRVRDSYGHTVLSTSATVVVDRTTPAISAADVTKEATGTLTVVTYGASATDNVDSSVSVSCSPASGSQFALGNTTVQCTASDSAGNTGNASFTVKVQDTTAPAVNVPPTLTKEATGPAGAAATFTASGVDLVDGSVSATCTPASGATFALGSTTVTCSSTDLSGNAGSATFAVDVVDTTAPTLNLPANIIAEATAPTGADVTFAGSGSDLVSGTVAAICNPGSGSTFPLGTTQVQCTATDVAGNQGHGLFLVTVRDTTAPVVHVPADSTLEATSAAGATGIYAVPVSDAGSLNLVATCTPASGSTFAIGTTQVTCTATDLAGNTGGGTFNIKVQDTTAPAIASVTPSLGSLWPADHKMVSMSVAVVVSDRVDPGPQCRISSIMSNESIDGLGDGDTSPDWVVDSGVNFKLRAERSGKGNGRIYTVTVSCTDASHNTSTAIAKVTVPVNQSGK